MRTWDQCWKLWEVDPNVENCENGRVSIKSQGVTPPTRGAPNKAEGNPGANLCHHQPSTLDAHFSYLSWDIQHLILLAALTSRNIIFATRQFTTTRNNFGNEILRYALRTLRYAFLAWHETLASFGHFSISSSSSQLCHRHPLFAKSSREICFARRVAAHLRFDARVSLAKTMSTQCF